MIFALKLAGDLVALGLYAGFAAIAYLALIRGQAVPTRQWATVIVLIVVTYPWGLVNGLVTAHVINRWLASQPAHPGLVLQALEPMLTVWHDIPLIGALILGFSIIRKHLRSASI